MKKTLMFATCILFLLASALAQTVDEVVTKHIEAMGGVEKLKALNTIYLEGVAVLPNGNEITAKQYRINNKVSRREVDFGMGSVSMIVTDKEGWSTNPRSGGAYEKMPDQMYNMQRSELDLSGPLVDYAAKGTKVELVGKETFNGKDAFKLKLTMSSGREVNYFIDTQSYYLIGQSMKAGAMGGRNPNADPNAEMITEFSDFRKTPEGYVFPYAITNKGQGATMNIEKIEVNKPLDESKLVKREKL